MSVGGRRMRRVVEAFISRRHDFVRRWRMSDGEGTARYPVDRRMAEGKSGGEPCYRY